METNGCTMEELIKAITGGYEDPVTMAKNASKKVTFFEMLKHFEDGYDGVYTNGSNDFTYHAPTKTLLAITENTKHPVTITTRLLNSNFMQKSKIAISVGDAMEIARNGEKAFFEANIKTSKYEGWISSKNGRMIYSIKQDIIKPVSDNELVLNAIMFGKWFI